VAAVSRLPVLAVFPDMGRPRPTQIT
jgi:hypothetical protein